MSEILDWTIQSVLHAKAAWCRYITANDTGKTGSHQAGFYVPKCASSLLFDTPGRKGENKEKLVKIRWQNDFLTESCMKYYGQGTRNEYRITRFGRNFPFFQDDNVGDLLVLVKYTEEYYHGYVLSSDEDIDGFLAYFGIAPGETNRLISPNHPEVIRQHLFEEIALRSKGFPDTRSMALWARECCDRLQLNNHRRIETTPDSVLLHWLDTEYELFRFIEQKIYTDRISRPFDSVDQFVQVANEVLNRRKSRAGKSLEHHLSDLFTRHFLVFEEQAVTEDNKRPDFLFPNSQCYHNLKFPASELVMLGAKTTCKDRWRQVLTEADRIDRKYLFTLQQGISKNQLKEMSDAHLTLVVPRPYLRSFPKEYQSEIQDLSTFITFVKEKQKHLPKSFSGV